MQNRSFHNLIHLKIMTIQEFVILRMMIVSKIENSQMVISLNESRYERICFADMLLGSCTFGL